MTLKKPLSLAALTLAALLAAPAGAATLLGSYIHKYGTVGGTDPGGNDVLNANSVTVSDQSSGRFYDSFDFSSLAYQSIDRFDLTLDYEGAGPSIGVSCVGFVCYPTLGELWTVRIQGSTSASPADDLFGVLLGGPTQTFGLRAADDVGGITAFTQTIASKTYAFWFSEWSSGADSFKLSSAKLDIYGTAAPAPVPLPAGGVMLLGALGGLALLRRRASRA